ncbi:MAG: Rrf2 family transcriptional regulator [Elusimicrobia bacterium]|nr:Rrf2 family transcriptional regulator [Elusimicrobiota bacterium]
MNRMRREPNIRTVDLAAPVRHALTALCKLARLARAAGAADLARAARVPPAALSKSLQRLARAGILESRRGPGGGYRLAVDPAKLSLLELADSLDVEDARRGRCVLEERSCRNAAPCALHRAARSADERLRRALGRLTLAELTRSWRIERQ